jgi:hypothetical protein
MIRNKTLNLRIYGELDKLTAKLKATGETAIEAVTRALEGYCADWEAVAEENALSAIARLHNPILEFNLGRNRIQYLTRQEFVKTAIEPIG